MANQKNDVTIVAWPKEPAKLEHQFMQGSPHEVSVSFQQKMPANVVIHTTPENPFDVDMNMKVSVKDTVPVCIKLCEPICAKSDYTISINIFDRPVGSISIKGLTKLFNCFESTKPTRTCNDFKELKDEMVIKDELTFYGLKFSPVSQELKIYSGRSPAGINKMGFPDEGVKISFPFPVDKAGFTIVNHGNPTINIDIFNEDGLIRTVSEHIDNELKTINIEDDDMIAVIIKGGSNEAALTEICYMAF